MTFPDPAAARPSFGRYWLAAAVSAIGTAVTAVAMPVLVVQTLAATPLQVGIVNAAQFVPYAVLGLIAGAYTDRWRRKPTLVSASLGRAVSLGAIPLLWLLGVLEIWMLVALLLAFGACSVFGFAATQSLLPRLVPRARLVTANARLDQADAAAQTLGPAVGGGLVGWLGAPVAIAVDAITFVVEAVLVAGVRVEEPRSERRRGNLRAEIVAGLRWAYRHRVLGPLAASTHVWFLANGAALTVLSLLALRSMGLSPVTFGILLAASGIATLAGATIAVRVGPWLGTGWAIITARAIYPVAWLLVTVAAMVGDGTALLVIALVLHGLAAGVENTHEMSLRQAVTPDELLGRVNSNIRSANRTAAAVGALLGGIAVGLVGDSGALTGVVALFAVAAIIAAASPLRAA